MVVKKAKTLSVNYVMRTNSMVTGGWYVKYKADINGLGNKSPE